MTILKNNHEAYLPGSTIGILGGGQLGRMIALEGRKMGYRFVTLDPTEDSPCGQVADEQIIAPYDDLDAAKELATCSDLVTYEFENVSAPVTELLAKLTDVPQGAQLLANTQDRLREKAMLQQHGIRVAPYAPVSTLEELHQAAAIIGYPLVLKTTTGGYDGKGQELVKEVTELELAFSALFDGATPLVAEAWLPLTKELSVIVARNRRGEISTFPVAENEHRHHILHASIVPARVPQEVATEAEDIAHHLADAIQLVGLLAVEFFYVEGEGLFVNELAPRPHNSGHYTYDAAVTSQFEQHVRAICNLPLGEARLLTPVVMVNILGQHVEALWECIPTLPNNVKIHWYGKAEVKVNRKMGHLTFLGQTTDELLTQIDNLPIWKGE